jgi:uncharacterized protein (TIGR04255 family)
VAFEPVGTNHAITEAVFGLTFERAFTFDEVGLLFNSHEQFKERLPGLNRLQGFPIFTLGQSITTPNAGLAFDRYNTAGGLERRLRLEGNAIYVNCLTYSRWEEVALEALGLISECMSIAIQTKNEIKGVLLQYIDLFEWRDNIEKYDLSQLFGKNNGYYPASIFEKGPFWHLHQGWFQVEGFPTKGRMLERLTTDGAINENGKAFVKMDCYLGIDIEVGASSSDLNSERGNEPSVRDLFNFLHEHNKFIVKQCLTQQMGARIGL